jgi:hypothetical protein
MSAIFQGRGRILCAMKLAAIAAMVLVLSAGAALADPAHPSKGPAKPLSNSADSGTSNGPKGNGPDGNGPNGPPPGKDVAGPPTGAHVETQQDQNDARAAVQNGTSVPLSEVLALAAQQGGRAIDAKLIRVQGMLLYQVTMLSDKGVSRRLYFYARTGNPVQLP